MGLASPDKIGEFVVSQISIPIVSLLHQLLPGFCLLFLININMLEDQLV